MGGISLRRTWALLLCVALLVALTGTPATAATKYSICHRPGKTVEQTLRVTQAQLWQHIRHGDRHGTCRVNSLIKQYGPMLAFHPQEKYYPDNAAVILNKSNLEWGILNNDSYDGFDFQGLGQTGTSASSLRADELNVLATGEADDPDFKYFVRLPDEQKPGNLNRAVSYVRVLKNGARIDLQYWFFYPYNGHGLGRVRVGSIVPKFWFPPINSLTDEGIGRHYGDWEHVTLQFSAQGKAQLIKVYMSRHKGGRWYLPEELQFLGKHPIVYVGRFTHANYPKPGQQNYGRVAHIDIGVGHVDVDAYDLTGRDKEFRTWTARKTTVVSSAVPRQNVWTPTWLRFAGPWGQYLKNIARVRINLPWPIPDQWVNIEKQVNPGPAGPPRKAAWTSGDKNGPAL